MVLVAIAPRGGGVIEYVSFKVVVLDVSVEVRVPCVAHEWLENVRVRLREQAVVVDVVRQDERECVGGFPDHDPAVADRGNVREVVEEVYRAGKGPGQVKKRVGEGHDAVLLRTTFWPRVCMSGQE